MTTCGHLPFCWGLGWRAVHDNFKSLQRRISVGVEPSILSADIKCWITRQRTIFDRVKFAALVITKKHVVMGKGLAPSAGGETPNIGR